GRLPRTGQAGEPNDGGTLPLDGRARGFVHVDALQVDIVSAAHAACSARFAGRQGEHQVFVHAVRSRRGQCPFGSPSPAPSTVSFTVVLPINEARDNIVAEAATLLIKLPSGHGEAMTHGDPE